MQKSNLAALPDASVRQPNLAVTACPAGDPRTVEGYRLWRIGAGEAGPIPDGFRAVYGEDYLSAAVYDAAAIASAIADKRQISFLATAPDGAFAGHLALLRSAPNPRLLEIAQGIVHPDHRRAGLLAHLIAMAIETAQADPDCDGLYGTALTNHTISQKVLGRAGFVDTGLEVDYVPQRMLTAEGVAGPIATLVQVLDFGGGQATPCYLPPDLAAWGERLLPGSVGGTVVVARAPEPLEAGRLETRDMPRFDMARLQVPETGLALPEALTAVEREAAAAGRRTVQVVLALDRPEAAWAAGRLRRAGYAFSGLMPRYFAGGAAAGLFYRSFAVPNFAEIQTWSPEAGWVLAESVRDWQAQIRRSPAARVASA